MSNFLFLQTQWPEIFETAQEAEMQVYRFTKSSTLMCRSAMEQMIKWMYDNDGDLQLPESPTLETMMYHPTFKAVVHLESIINELTVIRKQGNAVAHKNKRISAADGIANVKYLFRFASWFSRYYGKGASITITPFDESNIQQVEIKPSAKEDIKAVQLKLQQKETPLLRAMPELLQSADDKAVIEERFASTKAVKATHSSFIDSPLLISEAETRLRFIDLFLEEAGWNISENNVKEFPITGMPQGGGRADYVLWGDDGLPLAVVEVKRTMRNAKEGQQQARQYADFLQQMTGQRPAIFYTNGFETWLWDDINYPHRRISGFYTKDELQLLISRRHSKQDLRQQSVNKAIADRYYQEEAIKRVSEQFENKHRGALLVMATGSGKTRVSAALVDILTKANWAKRILFLADRNALVTQAKRNFNNYLPNLTAIDLTKEEDDGTTRIVFSTYPTIMNRIDGVWDNNERYYGCGHFDLIIVDEAHRSVYNKYRAIFYYFDALLIGLTATPKISGIDVNTYELFDQEDHVPTFYYELDKAVADKYLVPPKALKVPLKFTRDGIKYNELSEKEKEDYEEKFGDPTQGAPDEIGSSALNNWLFNTDTVDKVLFHLMENGQKMEGGDKLGKTIIFARNNAHAEFIEDRFNKLYPKLKGHFLRIVTYKVSQVDDLIDDFKEPASFPQIAVSVDMLDTGIDIPEILNLVFFKPVFSSSKYWQMIGRGTRLCRDIFGPDINKQFFFIFDYCENFEFFQFRPDGIEAGSNKPLTQRIYESKLDVACTLESITLHDDGVEYITYRKQLVNELHQKIKELDKNSFLVRQKLQQYEEYKVREKWNPLTVNKTDEIKEHLSALVSDVMGEEYAKRFDLLLYNLQLHKLQGTRRLQFYVDKIISIAESLARKDTIPAVILKMPVIKQAAQYGFWDMASVVEIDKVRGELRDLMYCLDREDQQTFYTNYRDDIDGEMVEFDIINTSTQMEGYKRRVEKFIRENFGHISIYKLKNNIPISTTDIAALEKIMFEGGDLGTKADFENEYGHQPLGVFIRSIVGLDRKAVNDAFNYFLKSGNLTANQIRFIDSIIDYLSEKGIIEPEKLFEPPFTEIDDQGILGLFDEVKADELISIIRDINDRAVGN
jgi:type I restriction enzyme, R subunit